MATFPFDEFVSHIVTMYDVQADSILELYMKIAKYLNENPIVSEKTVAEIVNKYLEENPPSGGVTSVNGKTGDITDVYTAQNPPPYPVRSVNGQTGAANVSYLRTGDFLKYLYLDNVANANQIRANRRPSQASTTSFNDTIVFESASPYKIKRRHYVSGTASGADVTDTFYTDRNPPPYPVKSVNGQTGDVVISGVSAGVASVNGKTGEVTGLYDAENPPPYPVTSVNEETGAVTVKRIYSPDGNAHIRQANPDATHTRAFYAESTFDGVRSLISCSFDEDDNIHMQIKRGDNAWRDAILYTTKNPPSSSSGGGDGLSYMGVVGCTVSGSGTDSVTANFSGLSEYIGGDGFVVFKYSATSSGDTSIVFSVDGAGEVHTAMVGSTSPYPITAAGTFVVPLSLIEGTSVTVENVTLGGADIYITSSNFKAYVYN